MLLELTADMLTIIGGLVVAYIIYLLFIKEENVSGISSSVYDVGNRGGSD